MYFASWDNFFLKSFFYKTEFYSKKQFEIETNWKKQIHRRDEKI